MQPNKAGSLPFVLEHTASIATPLFELLCA